MCSLRIPFADCFTDAIKSRHQPFSSTTNMKHLKIIAALSATLLMAAGQAQAQTMAPTVPIATSEGKVYGFLDTATCLIWANPAVATARLVEQMSHDTWGLNGSTFTFLDVANKHAAAIVVEGKAGWRLPTVVEARSFFTTIRDPRNAQAIHDQLGATTDPYWTSDISAMQPQAAAVRPAPLPPVTTPPPAYAPKAPIVQWYTRTGARTIHVWPVKWPDAHEMKSCPGAAGTAAINPFRAN